MMDYALNLTFTVGLAILAYIFWLVIRDDDDD